MVDFRAVTKTCASPVLITHEAYQFQRDLTVAYAMMVVIVMEFGEQELVLACLASRECQGQQVMWLNELAF